MSTLSYDLNTVEVLWRRDVKRFSRQPARIVSAIGQPLIFWFVLGAGLGATFSIPGLDVDYMEFFFPGVVTMMLLFASIFAAVSVIDDRNQGFLQSVLAGPASRPAMVLGKCLGSTTVALIQAGLFIALAPLAGFHYGDFNWPMLISAMVLASFGLTALGFSVAWALNSMQAYHAVQMTILVPLWVVSGAMFPAQVSHPVFATIMRFNPVAYAVSAVRHALYGGLAPSHMTLTSNPMLELGVVAGFAAIALFFASCAARRSS